MKVAYIFHGHSRTWNQCYESFFENVFSVLPGDIFIHTWNRVNPSIGSYWNGWVDLTGEKLKISNEYADVTGIIKTYNPKIIMVEEHPIVDTSWCSFANDETKAQCGVKYMLYSSRKIFEESLKYNDYDYFVSTRLDIKYLSKLDVNEINLQRNHLIIPNCMNFDIFALGPKHLIDIKTNYYYHVDQYWYHNPCFINSGYETVLARYLSDNRLPLLKTGINFEIVRPF